MWTVGGGGITFENAGEKSFWGGIENFRFCSGGLTLDDTVIRDLQSKNVGVHGHFLTVFKSFLIFCTMLDAND